MVLDRYIAKAVLTGCVIASVLMLSIFAFVDFVAQLNDVGTGDYGTLQAALFVLLRLPQRLYELAPSILLLGGILSLGAMAANSELIVMRASGITTMRITRSVLQTGLLIAILVALLGEYVVPAATRTAKSYRAEAMEKKLSVGGMNDIWARDGDRYVNVKQILPDHQLRQISVYELNENHQLNSIIYAEKARYQDDEWVLDNIKRSEISAAGVNTLFQKQLIMKRLILLELFSVLELESQDMSAAELLTYSEYLQENNLDTGEYLLSFWIKVFTPFTCLAMLLIAMPIVFATSPRSGGAGQRIMMALLIGIVYFVVNRSINHLGLALDVAPLLSASLPLLLVIIISFYFMRRVS
jgi:lipopolysaccharide export system permease protein